LSGSRVKSAGKVREAEEARLAAYFKSIAKHRRALDLAIEEGFGGELVSGAWRDAFDSSDAHDAIRTMSITASHSAILNGYVEVLKAASGARLIGLLPHRRPHADQVFDAVCVDGGLTTAQTNLLNTLYVLEGRLEHASPDVQAEEVREAVERLRSELPGLIESTRDWLARHGIEFKRPREGEGSSERSTHGNP
jgi:hypothetical protein